MTSQIIDPNGVHEVLAILSLALLLATALLVIIYIPTLDRFFDELKAREPEVWTRIGSPRVLGMMMKPLPGFRRFYAFVPILKRRARMPSGEYRYARPAYLVLRIGLTMTLCLFGVAGLMVAWIFYYGL